LSKQRQVGIATVHTQ